MNIRAQTRRQNENGSIVAYFIFVVILVSGIASLATYVTQTTNITKRRGDMIASREFAYGGVVVGVGSLNKAVTNIANTLVKNLSAQYFVKNGNLSDNKTNVYDRTVSAPFSNQTVYVQIWMKKGNTPTEARVVGTALVGKVTESATVNVRMG